MKQIAAALLILTVLGVVSASADEDRFRVTSADFEVALRPEPDSFRVVTRIPPASKVKVLNRIQLDQGMAKINWYEVEYEGQRGWLSGSSLDGDNSELTYSVKYRSPYEGDGPSGIVGTSF